MKRSCIVGLFVLVCFLVSPAQLLCRSLDSQEEGAAGSLREREANLAALKEAEKSLKARPGDPPLVGKKVDALMALHRYRQAAQAAYPLAKSSDELRFKAGLCLEEAGFGLEAFQVFAPLFTNPSWAERAYAESVKALLSEGRELEAVGLLAEAGAKLSGTSLPLLRLSLALERDPANRATILKALAAADPQSAQDYEAQQRMSADAGGEPYCSESLEADLPASIPLREVTETLQGSSFMTGVPRLPRKPAPSARWSGSGTYSWEPPAITVFADTRDTQAENTFTRAALPVDLAGVGEVDMVLDSAVREVLISSAAASALALPTYGEGETWAPGLDGPIRLPRVLIKRIRIGPLVVRNVPALVVESKDGLWTKTAGSIPLWLLRHHGIRIDRRSGRLTLYEAGTKPESVLGPEIAAVTLRWFGGRPFAQVTAGKGEDGFFLVGVCSPYSYLELSALPELGVPVATSQYGIHSDRGTFGIITSGVADKVELGLGPARIAASSIRASRICPGEGPPCSGLLGRDILDLFDLYVDYHADLMAFKGSKS